MLVVARPLVTAIGDELSLLEPVFVDTISNLDKNPDFKCFGLGNPKDTTDALGRLAEPLDGGWESGIDQTPVTKTWKIKRPDGVCIRRFANRACSEFRDDKDHAKQLTTAKQRLCRALHWLRAG